MNAVVERNQEFRDTVMRLQEHLLEHANQTEECPVRHFFSNGVYARELTIPKGFVLVGKIHRYPHLNIISKGRIRVSTEAGVQEIEAPYTFVGTPGVKRAGYALEDTVWTTIHATEETDLEKIEAVMIVKDYDTLELEHQAQAQLTREES